MSLALQVLLAAGALAYLVVLWWVVLILIKKSQDSDPGGWFFVGPLTMAAGAIMVLGAFGVGQAGEFFNKNWQGIVAVLTSVVVPLLGYKGYRARTDALVEVAKAQGGDK